MNTHCFGSQQWELWKNNQLNGSNPQPIKELIGSFISAFEEIVRKYPEVFPFIGLPRVKCSTVSNPMVELDFPFASGSFQTPDMLVKSMPMVHFTSFEVAQEILSSGLIRLYNPNFGNDPHEVSGAAMRINPKGTIDRRGIDELFTISFTEERAINELTMWKLYGRDGDGVALVIELVNPTNWFDWYLGSISYLKYDQITSVMSKYKDLHEELSSLKETFEGVTFEFDLLPAFAFYKSDLFLPENEIRLLFRNKLEGSQDHFTGHWQDDHMNPQKKCGIKTYHTINRRLESVYYCTYPVYWHLHNLNPEEYLYYWKGPQLRIKRVVLGHNHDQKKADKMKEWHDEVLAKRVTQDMVKDYSVEFSQSPIRTYFDG